MANRAMESKARRIFRGALALHYIDGLDEAGSQVESWLKKHGGWLPDPQELYGDGTPLDQPVDEGDDATSKYPVCALDDAKALMPILLKTLNKEIEIDPDDSVCAPIARLASDWLKENDSNEVCTSSSRVAGMELHATMQRLQNEIEELKVTIKDKDKLLLQLTLRDEQVMTLKDENRDLKDIIKKRDIDLHELTVRFMKNESTITILTHKLDMERMASESWKKTCSDILDGLQAKSRSITHAACP